MPAGLRGFTPRFAIDPRAIRVDRPSRRALLRASSCLAQAPTGEPPRTAALVLNPETKGRVSCRDWITAITDRRETRQQDRIWGRENATERSRRRAIRDCYAIHTYELKSTLSRSLTRSASRPLHPFLAVLAFVVGPHAEYPSGLAAAAELRPVTSQQRSARKPG